MRAAISFCFLRERSSAARRTSVRRRDREIADLADVLAADLHRQRLRLQAIAAAGLARMRILVARQLLAHPVAIGLAEAPLDVADDALERLLRLVFAHAVLVDEVDLLLARAVEDGELHVLRQLRPRRRHRHLVVLGERLQRLLVVGRGACRSSPRDRSRPRFRLSVRSGTTRSGSKRSSVPSPSHVGQAPAGALNENSRGSISSMVKPDTGQAKRAEKMMRSCVSFLDLLAPWSRCRAASCRRTRRWRCRRRSPSAVSKLSASRVAMSRAHDEAVHHHVDVVLELLVELGRVGDLVEGAVDLDALEALLLQLGELLAELALAAAHDRRQQVEARALGQRQHAVDHLRHGLALDRQPGRRRIGHADAREQQAQVVVDLGDRADGRARVLRRRLLLDGDGRRQAVDVVDVRLLHHLQELARVGRQALDVAALAFGVDGVEGERRLARARQPREHDERVARDLEIDVLQVVLARAADVDGL